MVNSRPASAQNRPENKNECFFPQLDETVCECFGEKKERDHRKSIMDTVPSVMVTCPAC